MNTNNIRLSKDELKRLRDIDFTKVKSVSTAEEEFTQKIWSYRNAATTGI